MEREKERGRERKRGWVRNSEGGRTLAASNSPLHPPHTPHAHTHTGENTGVSYDGPETFQPETIEKLKHMCRADIELYEHAQGIFDRRTKACLA